MRDEEEEEERKKVRNNKKERKQMNKSEISCLIFSTLEKVSETNKVKLAIE